MIRMTRPGLLALALLALPAGAETLTVTGGVATQEGGLLLSAQPLHAEGPSAITHVAVELASAGQVWVFPALLDDGTGGDAAPGDGVWSQRVSLPGGAYDAVFIAVDRTGQEVRSAPVAVSVP